jgi:F-type H+-transporting ATPase subunit b
MSAESTSAPAETGTATEHPAAAGGLPQFDVQWWPGQIVWFLIIFGVVLLLMRTVFVPKIGGTIEARDAKIEGDVAAARALRAEADAQATQAQAEMAQARGSAQAVAAEAKAAARAEIAAGLAAEEARVAETVAAAEARIQQARDEAMTHVRGIASETAGAIVERLTGASATAAEIEAALAGRA